jgi:uroporphyrin-3 C-methyltransferase
MNSEPTTAPLPAAASPPAEPATATAPALPPPRPAWPRGLLVAWLLAGVCLVISVLLWQKVNGMQRQLARQSADASLSAIEARTLARQTEEAGRDTAAKVAVLESKVSDMSAYRTQLEDLVQTVARAHDQNLAVDLQAALRMAQDQTQLTGSVEPLLAALRTAERSLARSADPRLAPVAHAVARDLEHVKTANIPDPAGLLTRIDQLLRQADELPMAGAVGRASLDTDPAPPLQTPGGPAVDHAAAPPPASGLTRWWQGLRSEAYGLLRVSRIERPEATLLSPEQAFFVRENFKLRLQGARLGLLARQYDAARADLAAAQTTLGDWFAPAARRTQTAATLLQQIQGLTKAAELPRAQDTLTALGNAIALTAAGTPPAPR